MKKGFTLPTPILILGSICISGVFLWAMLSDNNGHIDWQRVVLFVFVSLSIILLYFVLAYLEELAKKMFSKSTTYITKNWENVSKWVLKSLAVLHLLAILPFGVNENDVCLIDCYKFNPISDLIDSLDYYDILRVSTFILTLLLLRWVKNKNNFILYGLVVISILYNPILPVLLEKGTWVLLNITSSIYFIYLDKNNLLYEKK